MFFRREINDRSFTVPGTYFCTSIDAEKLGRLRTAPTGTASSKDSWGDGDAVARPGREHRVRGRIAAVGKRIGVQVHRAGVSHAVAGADPARTALSAIGILSPIADGETIRVDELLPGRYTLHCWI